MKNYSRVFLIVSLLVLTSCVKGYNHEKRVTNNSRESIEIITGCCDQKETYTIKPGESVVVFACVYQQLAQPQVEDLNWNIEMIREGKRFDLSNPDLWIQHGTEKHLKFIYAVND
jgi:hypothetical protein